MYKQISKVRENTLIRAISIIGWIGSIGIILFYQVNTYDIPTYDHRTLGLFIFGILCSFIALPDHTFDFIDDEIRQSTSD